MEVPLHSTGQTPSLPASAFCSLDKGTKNTQRSEQEDKMPKLTYLHIFVVIFSVLPIACIATQ